MRIRTFRQAMGLAKTLYKNRKAVSDILSNSDKKMDENENRIGKGLMHDIKMLRRMIQGQLSGKYKFSKRTIIYVVAGLIYFISPIDLIPDIFLGLGFVDDAAVLAMVIKRIKTEIDKYTELNTFDDVEVIE